MHPAIKILATSFACTLLSCAPSREPVKPMFSGLPVQDFVLANGTVYKPKATPQSDCALIKSEQDRLQPLVGEGDAAVAFAKRGPGERALFLYRVQITEALFFKIGDPACRAALKR